MGKPVEIFSDTFLISHIAILMSSEAISCANLIPQKSNHKYVFEQNSKANHIARRLRARVLVRETHTEIRKELGQSKMLKMVSRKRTAKWR